MGIVEGHFLSISISNETLVLPAEIHHYNDLPLSNLDHYVPIMVTTLYVYEVTNWATKKDLPQILRDSLAKALALYHPVAGRIKENKDTGKLEICYQRLGVPFVEAYADNDLSDLGSFFLNDGISQGPLIPDFSTYPGSKYGGIVGGPLLHVQVTQFRSGGLTLGIAFNHMIGDGISAGQFYDCWSSIARGVGVTKTPNLDRSFLRPRSKPQVQFGHLECFPLQDMSNLHDLLHKGTFEYKNFSFPVASLERLQRMIMKEAEATGPLLHKCTGFEALAALVWKARTTSLRIRPAQMLKFVFSMSARAQLPKENTSNYLGNLVLYPALICRAGDVVNMALSNIVRCIQNAKQTLTLEYVQSAIDHYEITRSPPTHDHLTFSIAQWTWLGLTQGGDFGWGAPLYVGPFKPPPNTRELGGILLTTGSKENGDQLHNLLLGLPSSALASFSSLVSDYLLESPTH